jgi:glycosyltransferase involved in cell wall biosynthesis
MKELWLFTLRYPYGTGESFLENELPILAEGYHRVRVFPLQVTEVQRALPANVSVHQVLAAQDVHRALPWGATLLELPRLIRVLAFSWRSAPTVWMFVRQLRVLVSTIRQALHRERVLRSHLSSEPPAGDVTLYSYWTSDWATVLGLWRMADPKIRFISRMMGFDLFQHRAPDGWQRLQAFLVAQVDHVYTISDAGLQHMHEHYPLQRSKFSTSFLATKDHGTAPWTSSTVLRVVSCANLIPLKRVHLLAEALALVPGEVHWTHFGDGEERGRLEATVKGLPSRIQVDMKGNRPNKEIIEHYRTQPTDVFVHTSSTEGGAPVALQEAASFGIPLIAADAGGVREIVGSRTGVLLDHGFSIQELATAIHGIRDTQVWNAERRAQVRAAWAERFNADVVYRTLLKELQHRTIHF